MSCMNSRNAKLRHLCFAIDVFEKLQGARATFRRAVQRPCRLRLPPRQSFRRLDHRADIPA